MIEQKRNKSVIFMCSDGQFLQARSHIITLYNSWMFLDVGAQTLKSFIFEIFF